MPNAGLIPIPVRVFDGVKPEATNYVDVEHPSFCFSPVTGELFVLTRFRTTHELQRDAAQYTYRYRRTLIVSVFGPDFGLRRQAVLDGLRAEFAGEGCDATLTVLPAGTVALFGAINRTWVYRPTFDERVAAYALHSKDVIFNYAKSSREPLVPLLDGNFAGRATLAPDGRLVCQLHGSPPYSVRHLHWNPGEIVAISREPVTDLRTRPELDFILRTMVSHERANEPYAMSTGPIPYLFVDGRPFSDVDPPDARFVAAASERLGKPISFRDVWIHEAIALGDGRFLINLAADRLRSGGALDGHGVVMVDATGNLTGHISAVAPGSGPHRSYDLDRTKGGDSYDVAVDRDRKWITIKTRDALAVFSYEGEELVRVPLTEEAGLKALGDFVIRGSTPRGGLLLLHPKRHTFMEIPLPDEPAGMAARVREALGSYEAAVKPVQKHYPNAKHYRINSGAEVFFEVASPESPALEIRVWTK